MKIYIVSALLLFFTACSHELSTTSVNDSSTSSGFTSFATLSSIAPAEAAASVVYTQIAQFRYNVTTLLRRGKISVEQAIIFRDRSIVISGYLDDAVKSGNSLKIRRASKDIAGESKKLGAINEY